MLLTIKKKFTKNWADVLTTDLLSLLSGLKIEFQSIKNENLKITSFHIRMTDGLRRACLLQNTNWFSFGPKDYMNRFSFLERNQMLPLQSSKKKLTRWVWGLLGIRPVVCGVAVLFGQIYTMHAHFSFKKVESLFTIQRINLTTIPYACPWQWN